MIRHILKMRNHLLDVKRAITLALCGIGAMGVQAGCDSLQGDKPLPVPEALTYPGISQLTANRNGTYSLVWPAVAVPDAKYRIFSRKKSEAMDWTKSTETPLTSFVTDDLRFSPPLCFAVRYFTSTINNDTNTSEKCTDGFSYVFGGLKTLEREASGAYTLSWDPAPIDDIHFRVYEFDSQNGIIEDSMRLVDGTRTRVGPFDLGVVKCFVVRAYADGYDSFDTNTNSRCTDNNKLSKFIGIESIASTKTGEVQLAWSPDDNPDVVGYIIYRGADFKETVARVDSRLQSNLTIDNVEPFARVTYGVRALTSFGSEDKNTRTAGVQVFSRLSPAFAGLKSAVLETANRVKLSWDPPPNTRSYQVFMAKSSKGTEPTFDYTIPYTEVPAEAGPSYSLPGLGDDEKYSFVVRAVSVFGVVDSNQIVQSVETPDAGPPKFAGIKTAVVKDGKVVLSWDRPVGQVTRFRVYVAKGSASALDTTATNIPPEPATATSAVIAGFQNGSDYTFLVRAEDAYGNLDSNLVTATLTASAQSLPVFMGYVGAQGIDERRIEVEFRTTNDANVASYTLDVRQTGQTVWGQRFFIAQDLSLPTRKFMINNLIPDKEYDVLVRSVDRWGNSSNNEAGMRGKTLDITPPVFTGIGGITQADGTSDLRVSWTPSLTRDISYYKIYYSTSTLADKSFGRTCQQNLNGLTVLVQCPQPISIEVTPAIPATSSDYLFTGLTKGQNYYFVVRAFDLYDNEDTNLIQRPAVVKNTFPGIGTDDASRGEIRTPEAVTGSPVEIIASDPDEADTLTFALDTSLTTCNLTAAPVTLQVFPKAGKQRKAILTWRPPFGYIPAGSATKTCDVFYTVTDGESTSPPLKVSLTAENRPPYDASAIISPATNPALGYLRNSNLTCVGTAQDDDGTLPTLTYTWIKNGVAIPGVATSFLTPAAAAWAPGDEIRCLVTADDSHDKVDKLSTAVTLGNNAPDLLAAVLSKDSGSLPVRVDDRVACTWTGRDLDGDTITYGLTTLEASTDGGTTWTNPDLPTTTCGIIETNKRCFTITTAVRRAKLRCAVSSATDGFAPPSTAFFSSARDVSNSSPSLSGVAVATGSSVYEVGTVLTCSNTITDRDSDALLTPAQFVWYRNGTRITGATSATYALALADRGLPVQCEVVVPANADGFGSAQAGPLRSTNSITYTNSNPRVSALTVLPIVPATGDVITCNYTLVDDDGDTVSTLGTYLRIKWFSGDGTIRNEITGEGTQFYTVRAADRLKRITCQVTLMAGADGAGSTDVAPANSSNEAIPINTNPVIVANSVVVTSPDSPALTGTALTCAYSVTDLDGDSATKPVIFSWTANGSTIGGQTTSSYTIEKQQRNKDIRCRVSLPSDFDGNGSAAIAAVTSTNAIRPVNSEPEILNVTVNAVSTAPYYPGTELSCNASTIRDRDGDSLTPQYKWYRSGTQISGQSGFTYTAVSADRGNTITCLIFLPASGDGNGSAGLDVASSNQFSISNRDPVVAFTPTLAVSGGGLPFRSSTLVCGVPASFDLNTADPDGDTVSLRYVWTVGTGVYLAGTDATGTVGESIDLTGKVSVNSNVKCEILISDAIVSKKSNKSAGITIQNRAPVIDPTAVVTLGPSTVYSHVVTPTLTCGIDPSKVSDPDGDAITFQYRYVKGTLAGANWSNLLIDGSVSLGAGSGGWVTNDTSFASDYPSGNTRAWRGTINRVYCEFRALDANGASTTLASAISPVLNSAPIGTTMTCNGGNLNLVAAAGLTFPTTTSCAAPGILDPDADTFDYAIDTGASDCPGLNTSIFVESSTGRLFGTAPTTACFVRVVIVDALGAPAVTAGGALLKADFQFTIPFEIALGAPSVDATCMLRQPTSFIARSEGLQSETYTLSALAGLPQDWVRTGANTTNGLITAPLNPANGGGNVDINWTPTGTSGSVFSLNQTVILGDTPAVGQRSAGPLPQPGIQPLPVEVSDGFGGTKSANCSLASCSGSRFPGSLSVGARSACAVATGGDAYCWGDNFYGQLGRGTLATGTYPEFTASPPSPPDPATKVDLGSYKAKAIAVGGSIAASSNQACAIAVDPANGMLNKGVYCWGDNSFGQLGRSVFGGSLAASGTPAQVTGLGGGSGTNAIAGLAVGNGHACAIKTAASQAGGAAIVCWGQNDKGQLGDGSTTNAAAPVSVQQFTTAGGVAVAAGRSHTCAITNVGGVRCWGDNFYGQLGSATPSFSATPVNVPGVGTDVIGIASGLNHVCALKQTGQVKCWGDFALGQTGDTMLTYAATGAVAIAAGGNHSCALLENGNLSCWGANSVGQLGAGTSGTPSTSATPIAVQNINNGALAVAAGNDATCVLLNDGKVKCFGGNAYGQSGIQFPQASPINAVLPNATVTPAVPSAAYRSCRELRAYVQ